VTALAAQSGRQVGIGLVELGGPTPQRWSLNGGASFVAASTYKLPLLMAEAGGIAAGTAHPGDSICYEPGDDESGWFDDYGPGTCFTRQELATRVARYSDNTAAHILVRDLGGGDVLNAFAAAAGATGSALWVPNTTTAGDLAAVWAAEGSGTLGGAAAQAWLYPLLTGTAFEAGITGGVPGSATVVHKYGWLDDTENDAALVEGSPNGAYVLTICTSGDGTDEGWALLRALSARVWSYETAR
jgi:beta-lactamase class A